MSYYLMNGELKVLLNSSLLEIKYNVICKKGKKKELWVKGLVENVDFQYVFYIYLHILCITDVIIGIMWIIQYTIWQKGESFYTSVAFLLILFCDFVKHFNN